MKRLPLFLILLVIFLPSCSNVDDGRDCIKGDCVNGKGTLTFPDGQKYVGEFKGSNFHGQGTFTSPNGMKYVGEFKGSNFHGQGTLIFPDGTKEVGEYKDGMYVGKEKPEELKEK